MLAVYLSDRIFRHIIEAQQVLLYSAFHRLQSVKPDKKQRLLTLLTEFIFDQGEHNIVADILSLRPLLVKLDFVIWQNLLRHDPKILKFIRFHNLNEFTLVEVTQFMLCDTSKSYSRLDISNRLRRAIFVSIHSIAHPGIKSSIKLIKGLNESIFLV